MNQFHKTKKRKKRREKAGEAETGERKREFGGAGAGGRWRFFGGSTTEERRREELGSRVVVRGLRGWLGRGVAAGRFVKGEERLAVLGLRRWFDWWQMVEGGAIGGGFRREGKKTEKCELKILFLIFKNENQNFKEEEKGSEATFGVVLLEESDKNEVSIYRGIWSENLSLVKLH